MCNLGNHIKILQYRGIVQDPKYHFLFECTFTGEVNSPGHPKKDNLLVKLTHIG